MTPSTLPPLLMTSEKGSFARKTIEELKPIIIDRLLPQYDIHPNIQKELLYFKSKLMQDHPLQPLLEACSDQSVWLDDISPWLKNSWLEMPWLLAEAYFFRRILEIVRYFQPGPWRGVDPYQNLKDREVKKGFSSFSKIYSSLSLNPDFKGFQEISYKVLWSNRGDLSNMTQYDPDLSTQSNRIILNQLNEAYEFLSDQPAKITYIFDNVGKELFFDLAFIDYLLENNLASTVTCYLKNQPFFVSDAMPKDLQKTVDLLETSPSKKNKYLAERVTNALKSNQIQIMTPPFFTFGRMFRQLPVNLKRHIGTHDLVILKGDVNYRRFIGDRHWPPTTSVKSAAGYFPTSILSFRPLKSEILIGLSADMLTHLNKTAEQNWRINGKRGMITFFRNLT